MARRDSMTAFGQLAEAIALVSQGKPGHIVDTPVSYTHLTLPTNREV